MGRSTLEDSHTSLTSLTSTTSSTTDDMMAAAHTDTSPIGVGAGTTVIVNAHKPRKPPKLNKGRRRSISLGVRKKRKNRRSKSVDSQTPRRSSLKMTDTSNIDHSSSSNNNLNIISRQSQIRRPQQMLSASYTSVSQTTLEELTAMVQRSRDRGEQQKKRLSPTTMEHLTAIVQRSTAEKKQQKQRRRVDKQQSEQQPQEPDSPQPQDSPKKPRRRSSPPPPPRSQPSQPKKSVAFGPVYVDFYQDKYHDKVPLNKKWYSAEDLRILMNHEVKIILRYQMGKVTNGSKRVRENNHACLRGFEHIKEERDKNERNRHHVLGVLRLQRELKQKQQEKMEKEEEEGDENDHNEEEEEDQDLDKEIRRCAAKSSYEDRKKAYKAGLQDASDILKDRKHNTKAMVANNSCTNSPIDTNMDKSYKSRFLGGMGSKSMRTGRTIPQHASSTNEASSSRLGLKIKKSMRFNRTIPMFSSSERTGSTRTGDNTMPTITTTTITKPKSAMSKSLRTDSTRRSGSKSSRKQRTMRQFSQSDRWDRADEMDLVVPIDERQTKSMRSTRTTATVTSTSEHPITPYVAPISEEREEDQLTVTKLQRVGSSTSSGDRTPVANNKDQATMAATAAVLAAATTLTATSEPTTTKPKKKKHGSKTMDNKSSSKSTRKQRTLSVSDHGNSNKDKKKEDRKTSKSMRGPRTTATSLMHPTTAVTNSKQDNDSKRESRRRCMNDELPPLVPIPGRMAK